MSDISSDISDTFDSVDSYSGFDSTPGGWDADFDF